MKHSRVAFKYIAVAVVIFVVYISRDVAQISKVQGIAGISIDPASQGSYIFGLELANADKGDDFTLRSKVLTVQAKNLEEALYQAGLRNEYPVVLTHGSLVVVGGSLLSKDMNKISEMLLTQWSGQTKAYLAVADGCSAVEILRHDVGENLRSGQLSEQIRRGSETGAVHIAPMMETLSAFIDGESITLPLVKPEEQSYRLVGSVLIGGEI